MTGSVQSMLPTLFWEIDFSIPTFQKQTKLKDAKYHTHR